VKHVLVITEYTPRYRVPFFERLQTALSRRAVGLRVAYSDPPLGNGTSRSNVADLPAAYGLKLRAYRPLGRKLLLQPVLGQVMRADLIILEQGNKFLLNPLLLQASRLGLKRVAFWGHGRSFQENPNRISEWYKCKTLNSVDWWFAYTHGIAEYLQRHGVPPEKITAVENSIDTERLRADLNDITQSELDQQCTTLGIPKHARIGIFCGRFYELKGLPLLIEAAYAIKRSVPEFHVILIGDGAECNRIGTTNGNTSVQTSDWIHYVGPRFDREKALLFKLADVFLLPGLVGLAVLDAFTASLPLITIAASYHSPEVEYITPGYNGLITAPTADAYAAAVIDLLASPDRLVKMRAAAQETSRKYTIDNMVANFVQGIESCLNRPA
jgi:glycosyltransferase involved in cell wall biosynthesis